MLLPDKPPAERLEVCCIHGYKFLDTAISAPKEANEADIASTLIRILGPCNPIRNYLIHRYNRRPNPSIRTMSGNEKINATFHGVHVSAQGVAQDPPGRGERG